MILVVMTLIAAAAAPRMAAAARHGAATSGLGRRSALWWSGDVDLVANDERRLR